ncbi:MAG TPA: nucleoside hydrolase [Roseiflexaceae bacterium]|nr:nucleoside hydrolase [Roseiflexaceae bacterium]
MPTAPLSDARRLELLEPPSGRVRMVLDTDTFNEIDDQFALVYALLSPERIECQAIYAAPFHNKRSSGPEDGMLRSYEEIGRVLDRLGRANDQPILKGSTAWLPAPDQPVASAAADDLIARARAGGDGPLYVVAIGAITNVASALLAAPEIAERIVVVWLGGQPLSWHHTREFNLSQDLYASRALLDSGAPLVRVPCLNVAEHLRTTEAEMERFVKGRGAIGDYLFEIYSGYYEQHYARSKEIWDMAPIAWLIEPGWVETTVVHSPILTADQTWSHDAQRHLTREARIVRRDPIFADLFRKLELSQKTTDG